MRNLLLLLFYACRPRTMTTVRVLSHTAPDIQRVDSGALNVQSANKKTDEIFDACQFYIKRIYDDYAMLLSETET